MSSGLCKTLNEVFSNDRNLVNKEIVQMAVEQARQSIISSNPLRFY